MCQKATNPWIKTLQCCQIKGTIFQGDNPEIQAHGPSGGIG